MTYEGATDYGIGRFGTQPKKKKPVPPGGPALQTADIREGRPTAPAGPSLTRGPLDPNSNEGWRADLMKQGAIMAEDRRLGVGPYGAMRPNAAPPTQASPMAPAAGAGDVRMAERGAPDTGRELAELRARHKAAQRQLINDKIMTPVGGPRETEFSARADEVRAMGSEMDAYRRATTPGAPKKVLSPEENTANRRRLGGQLQGILRDDAAGVARNLAGATPGTPQAGEYARQADDLLRRMKEGEAYFNRPVGPETTSAQRENAEKARLADQARMQEAMLEYNIWAREREGRGQHAGALAEGNRGQALAQQEAEKNRTLGIQPLQPWQQAELDLEGRKLAEAAAARAQGDPLKTAQAGLVGAQTDQIALGNRIAEAEYRRRQQAQAANPGAATPEGAAYDQQARDAAIIQAGFTSPDEMLAWKEDAANIASAAGGSDPQRAMEMFNTRVLPRLQQLAKLHPALAAQQASDILGQMEEPGAFAGLNIAGLGSTFLQPGAGIATTQSNVARSVHGAIKSALQGFVKPTPSGTP